MAAKASTCAARARDARLLADHGGRGYSDRVLARRLVFCLTCAAASGALLLAACSDDEAPAETPPADDGGTKRRDAPVEDVQVDAEAGPRPPPNTPACLGTALALAASGDRPYVEVNLGDDAGAFPGNFLVDFGANGSTIDRAAFTPPGPTPTSCLGDGGAPGALCTFPSFDFFGSWGSVSLVTADYSFLFNSVKQAGIIGTDFLSVYPFTLDFYGKRIWRATQAGFCTEAQLLGAGYAPVPTGGFYTNDVSKLRPLSDVLTAPDAATTAGFTVPNVPTVPMTIAGVAVLAQIDTGYDDRLHRHSININQALLEKLMKDAPGKISRFTIRDLFLTTCVPGLSQAGRAYKLEPGVEVNFLAEGGSVARHDTGDLLFVKERLAEAERCGGIETWTVPAAQIGASFLVDAQAAVFDPFASRVWLPKD
jgi:hypothetical protein